MVKITGNTYQAQNLLKQAGFIYKKKIKHIMAIVKIF